MPPKFLLIVASDPRTSGRPAEAIRVAAGLGVWKKVEVNVYLREPAVLILGEDTGDLVDGENYTRYLPLLGEFGRPVYVQKAAPHLPIPRESLLEYREITDAELAVMAAENDYVARF